jgi:hypothetical protein
VGTPELWLDQSESVLPGCGCLRHGAGVVTVAVLLTPGSAVLVVGVVEVAVDVLVVIVDVAAVVVLVAVVVDAVLVTVVVGVVVVNVVVELAFFVTLGEPKNVDGAPLPVIDRPARRSGTVKTATTIAKASRPVPTASSHRERQRPASPGSPIPEPAAGAVSAGGFAGRLGCRPRDRDCGSPGVAPAGIPRLGPSGTWVVSCGAAVVRLRVGNVYTAGTFFALAATV